MNGTCPRTPEGTLEGHLRDTNNNDNNIIYLSLLNKYKKQTAGKNFGEKIKAINQCKGEKLYGQLTDDEQIKLTADLMAIK